MNRRGLAVRLIVAVALAGAIVELALHRDFLQAARLERELRQLGGWAPILFILCYALATVLFVPGAAFSIAGGALFGPLLGTACNLTGATLGAMLAFLAARYLAFDWVAKKSGERLDRVMRGVEAEGWRFVALVRLVPLFPFNLLNYGLGLTRIGFSTYLLTSAVCMIPGAFAYTWLGYAGRQAVAGGENLVRDGLIALALLAAIALLPRLLRRFQTQPSLIESDQLREQLAHTAQTLVIDVRTPEEFTGSLGHIPGARNILLAELADKLWGENLKDGPIVLVCKTDKRSSTGAVMLRDAGFARVSVLRGGMESWQRSGYSVEK